MKNLAAIVLIALLNGIAFAAPTNDGIDPTKKNFKNGLVKHLLILNENLTNSKKV